jgi:iron complex transport system ATP-binding protein
LNILCENISFKYEIQPVLEDISIKFGKGHLYGIIGPNGSGKTTLLKVLNRILKINFGQIIIDKVNINNLTIKEIAKKIAMVNQSTSINFDFTVEEIVKMGRYSHIGRFSQESIEDKKLLTDIFEQFELFELGNRIFNELSGGEQQKVIIARAIAQQSRILLLDEPTNHLDINYKIELMDLLRKYVNNGIIIIIVLHDLNLAAQFCDKIVLLNKGKIKAFGNIEDTITRENIKNVYNIDVIVKKNIFSNSIFITPLEKKQDLPLDIRKKLKKIKIHIFGGGGGSLEILPKFREYDISIGVINKIDDDFTLAKELNYKIISEEPFCPISDGAINQLNDLLINVDLVILTNVPFGKTNQRNLELLREFKRNIIIYEKDSIEERDFTDGIATEIYNEIKKKKNVIIVKTLKSLFEIIKNYEVENYIENKRKD